MGKKKQQRNGSADVDLTEDQLLDALAQENKATADRAAAGIRPLSQPEVVAKLDQVMLLNIIATGEGESQIVANVDGEVAWYADPVDAKNALAKLQAKMPPLPGHGLGLHFTPLGRAYALSEGWVTKGLGGKSKLPPVMRLHPASKVLETCGEDGVKALEGQLPRELRASNKHQGAFPLFFLEELQSERVLPFFFSHDDLVACWVSSGKAVEDLPPQLSVIDLRALVARVRTEPNDWLARLHLVPSQGVVQLMEMLDGFSDKLEELGKLAAKATGMAIAEATAEYAAKVASGDEPPPLQ